ncbi:hypothetical protein QQG74_12725 [Micromonospora sp. FIMYZ51]|uniref:pentapeptide repeat-containing protein n=1 Tax=Micromonospora sp. FIMYZ51 TaxID=3051832 RepID=UPI00311EE42B
MLSLFLAFAAAFLASWLIFLGLARLSGAGNLGWIPRVGDIPRPDLFDLVRSTVTSVGLFAGVFAIIYSYRKQRIEESASRRADAEILSKRYQDAASLLGHESAAVRLAGVYALTKLADDDELQRLTISNVLCAYLRMPYEPEGAPAGEREVRHAIIRAIAERLVDPASSTSWCGFDLDFTDCVFDGGSFTGAYFTAGRVSFDGARFIEGHTHFDRTHFTGAHVSFGDGDSHGADFCGGNVSFTSAEFSAGYVTMTFAKFTGGMISFGDAKFKNDGALSFSSADFNGAWLTFGGPIWIGATMNGGRISFAGAKLASGLISLDGLDMTDGEISFESAEFRGAGLSFYRAELRGGKVDFTDARFESGKISWEDAGVAENVVQPWPLPRFPRTPRRVPLPKWRRFLPPRVRRKFPGA